MHGTTLLSIVLLVLTGCSSNVLKGELNGAAPIAGTESFYAFTCDTVTDNSGAHPRFSLTRLEPDGSSRMIREVDGSLWMVDQLATDTAIVVKNKIGAALYLFSVASGEMSPLPKDYQYKFTIKKISDSVSDSLRKMPLLKGYDPSFVVPLFAEDCYLVGAYVPGTRSIQVMDPGSFSPGCFSSSPQTYLLVVDMKRSTLTNVGIGFPYSFSASRKHILVSDCDGRSDRSSIVSIADVLEQ